MMSFICSLSIIEGSEKMITFSDPVIFTGRKVQHPVCVPTR